MADYLNLDTLAVIAYILTLVICLGLIVYVVRGWHRRVRYSSRKLKRFPE